MSVLARNRKESNMEFLNKAHELELMTTRLCANEKVIPKRHRLMIGIKLFESARIINQNVTYANSIYPHNQEEYLKRKEYQKQARLEIRNFLELLRLASELLPIKGIILEEWSKLASDEFISLKKWMDSDRQRYKTLQ